MRRSPLLFVLLVLVAAPGTSAQDDPLDATNWKQAEAYILPTEPERRWLTIPWRASLWDAVIDANREQKPILLWAMNGHPLACT